MPYSFIDIEKEKNWLIGGFFIFLIGFYFVTALILAIVVKNLYFVTVTTRSLSTTLKYSTFLSAKQTLIVLIIALVAGLIHWFFSVRNVIDRILRSIDAESLNSKDTYHQMLRNIVDEVSVATGGKQIECYSIPAMSMNAFALQDFDGRSVIGVTEGLLARLNRAQLEAVVGHEAAHIVSGDCLMTTISCALFGLYGTILKNIERALSKNRHSKVSIYLIVVYAVLHIMQGMSYVLRMFISRQREYRSDAVAVRLTRDPLSLSEALYKIARGWRGVGMPGEKLSPIFIVNPKHFYLDETEGINGNLFSTHPPINKRIDILLDMAHSDLKVIEENLEKGKKIKIKQREPDEIRTTERSWFLNRDGEWQGPLFLSNLMQLEWLSPNTWIRRVGEGKPVPAYADAEINKIFQGEYDGKEFPQKNLCPHCKQTLGEVLYEGTPILKCNFCKGVLVDKLSVNRIIAREDMGFSDDIKRQGGVILKSQKKFNYAKKNKIDSSLYLQCPKCNQKMHRYFFNLAYPIETDKCFSCNLIWFDKDELELLQYLIETNKEIKY